MQKRRLNADIEGSISRFESVVKSFEQKNKLYKIMLKGKGLDFEGYRVYTNDDDSSLIDWKASKRANQTLVKQYIEERDLKVVFIIDVSENMIFGSTEKLKCEYAAEVIAALTKLIINSGNKVGYVFFSDNIKTFTSPGKGENHFGRFMDLLTDASIYGGTSDLSNALDFSLKYFDKSISSIVIVSDFIKMDDSIKEKLSLISSRFETMSIMIKDPLDRTLPDVSGEFIIEDSLTGQRMLINPALAKKRYEDYSAEQEIFVKDIFRKRRIDMIELTTDRPFAVSLADFIKRRIKFSKKVPIL